MTEHAESEREVACAEDNDRADGDIPTSQGDALTDDIRTGVEIAPVDCDASIEPDVSGCTCDLAAKPGQPEPGLLVAQEGQFLLMLEQSIRHGCQPGLPNRWRRCRQLCSCHDGALQDFIHRGRISMGDDPELSARARTETDVSRVWS